MSDNLSTNIVRERLLLHKMWLNCVHQGSPACFYGESLRGMDFRYEDLRKIDFRYANLAEASFTKADLRGACFHLANLWNADFAYAIIDETTKGLPPIACPEVGGFTAFKKVLYGSRSYVAELYIPADAQRSSATTRKCRSSKAKVVKFWNLDRTEACIPEAHSLRELNFKYKKGEYVYPWCSFDENRWRECASGIHFFMTFNEARDY